MKFITLALFCLVFVSSACRKDGDNGPCMEDDFVGVYTGSYICNGAEANEVEVSIEKNNGRLEYNDGDGFVYPISVSGCKIKVPEFNILVAKLSGDGRLEGNELTVSVSYTSFGNKTSCNFEGSK